MTHGFLTRPILSILAALFVASALVSAAPARAADRLSLLLDWYVNPNHGPIILAEEWGYFAEAGLEVEAVAPSDPSLPPRLVAAGEADLAISYQQQIHLQVGQGLPLRRVGVLIASPLNCLMTRADGPVANLADLEGRKVGYSVAGVEEALMRSILAPHGLELDDVEMINVNWSLTPSLMSGQVDAVIGAYRNVELLQIELNGVGARCFYLEQEGSPVYDELIYVANAAALEDPAMRSKIARFLHAVERATQRLVNDPEAAFEAFAATGPERGDELNRKSWAATTARYALAPAALDRGRYDRFAAFLLEQGLIAEAQTAADVTLDLSAEPLVP